MASPPTLSIVLIANEPAQYSPASWAALAREPGVSLTVALAGLGAAAPRHDREFGHAVQWDVPLTQGYPWVLLDGAVGDGPRAALDDLLRRERCDVLILQTGWRVPLFWRAGLLARRRGIAVAFGSDAHQLDARDGRTWKAHVKRRLWPRLLGLADALYAPSTATAALYRRLGVADTRMALAPYAVDNARWLAANVDRNALRRELGLPQPAPLLLYCGKLQPWKGVDVLLRALATLGARDAHLAVVGSGPSEAALRALAAHLDVSARVHWLGFRNQLALPALYAGADVVVVPSRDEPFGLVVNEAMLCGAAVVASDRVGAARDLIQSGVTGWTYPGEDATALAACLDAALADRSGLVHVGERARALVRDQWGPSQFAAGMVTVARLALAHRRGDAASR